MGRTKIGDLSTFIHEPAHGYLYMIKDLAQRAEASDMLKGDYQKILKFLGADEGKAFTEAQHEQWAQANETYFLKGEPPTPGMRGVFQRIGLWMQSVYRNATKIGVELDPEIKGVFNRLYAGDRAIEEAQQLVDMTPMFATAELMGWTKAEFDLYTRRAEEALSSAHGAINQRLQRDLWRQKQAAWQEQADKVRAEVGATVDASPDQRAFQALREGKVVTADGAEIPVSLNRKLVEEQFGKDVVKSLPHGTRDHKGVGTMDAEAAAEILGFESGQKLIDALRNLEPRKERIERITDERMKAEHGDLLTDGSLPERAIEDLHNQAREETLSAELRALRQQERQDRPVREFQRKIDEAKSEAERKAAEDAWEAYQTEQKGKAKAERAAAKEALDVPPREAFVAAAQEFIGASTDRSLDPYNYLLAGRRASKEAYELMSKKDFKGAAEAKQRELLNHHLYLEAVKARAEVQEIAQYGKDGAAFKFQSKLGQAGGDYLNQWNALAGRYEFRTVSGKELDQRASSLEAWALAQEAAGEGIIIAPDLMREGPTRNWREVPISELRAVRDALKNIESIARRELKVIKGDKSEDFHRAVLELTEQIYNGELKIKPLPLDPLARSMTDKAVGMAKKLNASISKMERLVDHLDVGDINGPFRRYIFEPMALAQFKEYELNQKVTSLLAAALETMPKAQRHSLLDIHDIEGVGKVTKKFILSMALNWGNDGNREKMLKGMGWANNLESVGKAFDQMTRSDWEFVQKTWDAIDTLWPEIADLQKRMVGVEPPRVERTPFQMTLADGTKVDMSGGYYPLVYDRTKSTQGAKQADNDIMNSEGGFAGPVTFKGHTKARVKFSAPLNMDFEEVLIRHTSQVIKDISHREAAMSVAKIIKNQDVRQALAEAMGPEYVDMLMPWLKGTVNDLGGDMGPDVKVWKSLLMTTRSNMVLAGLSFRAGSVAVQLTDFGRAMTMVKPRFLGQAIIDYTAHPIDTVAEVRGLSKEMLSRSENLDRDTRSMLKRLQGDDGFMAKVQKFGMEGLAVADTITSVTTWLGAYRQAMAEHSPQEQAVREADRAVRLTMMSSAPKDLTAVQRVGDVGIKFMTMFLGDATASAGVLNRNFREVASGKNIGANLFQAAMVASVFPILGQLIKNRGPQDEEDKAWWVTKNALLAPFGHYPLVRDISQALESGMDYKFTPVANAIDKAVKAARVAGKFAAGDKDWDDAFVKGFDAAGTLAGVPGTSQVMTSVKYLRDVKSGKQSRPDSDVKHLTNIIFGPPPKGK